MTDPAPPSPPGNPPPKEDVQQDRGAPPHICVGSIVVAKLQTAVCFIGELGVCYELYELEGRPGYGFIFETGRHDGFSPDDVSLILNLTGRICDAVADYQFRNVGQLAADFRSGRFVAAFPKAGRA